MTGLSVDDGVNADEMVGHYNQYLTQEKARTAQEQECLTYEQANAEQAELAKQHGMASMLISSGFNLRATPSPSTQAISLATMQYRWTAQRAAGLGA